MDTKKLAYLYNLTEEQIKTHSQYLSFELSEHCCYYEPEPYVQIGPSEFSKPIEHMLKYYSNVNTSQTLSNVLGEAKKLDGKSIIKYSSETYSDYGLRDQVLLQYISNRPKTFILTVWPCSSPHIDQIINFLQTNGLVIACREINLSYGGAQNLIANLYNKILLTKTSIERKLKFINSKLTYSKFVPGKSANKFYVIVFENINKLPISGTGAVFKTQLRELIKSLILEKSPNENIELPDTVHINDFFYEAIEYAQTYFHEQTLINLENRILTNWLDQYFYPSYLRLNAFKNWQIKNLSTLESQRLILLTGSSFATTGIRKSSDIDSIFLNIGMDTPREQELVSKIYKDFFNEQTKIPFADSGMPGTIAWKDSWTKANNDFYKAVDLLIDDFILVLDPSMYYYWNGLKIMTFDLTIEFKLHRYIPSDYVDFIVLSELYPNITNLEIVLSRDKIWANKPPGFRSPQKINQLIIKSFDRYLINDKKKINIKKYLL
jgi:hypothetical protein